MANIFIFTSWFTDLNSRNSWKLSLKSRRLSKSNIGVTLVRIYPICSIESKLFELMDSFTWLDGWGYGANWWRSFVYFQHEVSVNLEVSSQAYDYEKIKGCIAFNSNVMTLSILETCKLLTKHVTLELFTYIRKRERKIWKWRP
jgi:hypothetical protein